MKLNNRQLANIIYPIISLFVVIIIWYIIALAVDVEIIIPSVGATFKSLWALLGNKTFYLSILGTIWRSLLCFFIGLFAAIFLAVVTYFFPVIYKLLSPIITIMRAIPTMSIILMTIIWLNPKYSPILIAFLIIFPIMYANFYTAISMVDKDLIEMSKAYKVSKRDMILSLYLPSMAPNFFDTMQSVISLTVKIIISAEVLAQTKTSMGVMMMLSKGFLDTPELLAWTFAAITVSYIMEIIVIVIKKMVIKWQ